jgi:hypothetical protein
VVFSTFSFSLLHFKHFSLTLAHSFYQVTTESSSTYCKKLQLVFLFLVLSSFYICLILKFSTFTYFWCKKKKTIAFGTKRRKVMALFIFLHVQPYKLLISSSMKDILWKKRAVFCFLRLLFTSFPFLHSSSSISSNFAPFLFPLVVLKRRPFIFNIHKEYTRSEMARMRS